MTTQEVKRKLTAILSEDVKGYSRLMGEVGKEGMERFKNWVLCEGDFIEKRVKEAIFKK